MELSQAELASAIHLSADQIECLVDGKRTLTAHMALRLAHYFGMSPRFWLGLQMEYDLDLAEDEMGAAIRQEISALVSR